MGTRLLTRSFTVEQDDHEEDDSKAGNSSLPNAMDVDTCPTAPLEVSPAAHEEDETENAQDSDEESDEETNTATMLVPMADMLNARYKANQVLFPLGYSLLYTHLLTY